MTSKVGLSFWPVYPSLGPGVAGNGFAEKATAQLGGCKQMLQFRVRGLFRIMAWRRFTPQGSAFGGPGGACTPGGGSGVPGGGVRTHTR